MEPQFTQRKAEVHRRSEGARLTPVENENGPALRTRMTMDEDRFRYSPNVDPSGNTKFLPSRPICCLHRNIFIIHPS